MAWFSGKVSLGGFPDLAGAVNKLSESVKNIEKNFDTALGFEENQEKSESSSSEGSFHYIVYIVISLNWDLFAWLFCMENLQLQSIANYRVLFQFHQELECHIC